MHHSLSSSVLASEMRETLGLISSIILESEGSLGLSFQVNLKQMK